MKQLILVTLRWIVPAFTLILIATCINSGIAFGKTIRARTEVISVLQRDADQDNNDLIYEDSFDTKNGKWREVEYDNISVGYLEPTYFHVDVLTSHDHAIATIPKEKFTDFTLETIASVETNNTDQTKDFRFGLIFRRTGQQFYAFTISPLDKTWHVQKSSVTSTVELASGASELIQNPKFSDTLRVDVKGINFALYINGQLVRQITDFGYASGEAGFFVQTGEAQRVQIHYDNISVRKPQSESTPLRLLYEENFDSKKGEWRESEYDNYTIGYHEPTFYHIDVHAPQDRAFATVPKLKFGDLALESTMFVEQNNTNAIGDYRYGLVFRKTGQQFYAFTISPSTKTWHMQKSSGTAFVELMSGSSDLIQGPKYSDTLRVDGKGPTFTLYINNQPIRQITDWAYVSGEAGFFVQTLDTAHVHVHYDDISIREAAAFKILCNVFSSTLAVRDVPSSTYKTLSVIKKNYYFEPIARSPDSLWLYIRLNSATQFGWIANIPNVFVCTTHVTKLPLYRN